MLEQRSTAYSRTASSGQAFRKPPGDPGASVKVHVLPHRMLNNRYVLLRHVIPTMREVMPDIIQTITLADPIAWCAALAALLLRVPLFVGNHNPSRKGTRLPLLGPRLSAVVRRLGAIPASVVATKCYAVTGEAARDAVTVFGLQSSKVVVAPLGTDTTIFYPASSDSKTRVDIRAGLGYQEQDVVCVYSGRLTPAKNPLALAKAVSTLRRAGLRIFGLFIGDGEEAAAIRREPGCTLLPYVSAPTLADYYRASDLAVWPRSMSSSQLDALACGLPTIVQAGLTKRELFESGAIGYNGSNPDSLVESIRSVAQTLSWHKNRQLSQVELIRQKYSWLALARQRVCDYEVAVQLARSKPRLL